MHLPAGPWRTVLDALCAHFAFIARATWIERMARGVVLDMEGRALGHTHPYREGMRVQYFREIADEPAIPFVASVLHMDEHLLVADKPHFLPVTPVGRFVRETLLARLIEQTGNALLTPLHRIDRDTAGLVLFSTNIVTRAAYHALFREQRISKYYEARAGALPEEAWPRLPGSAAPLSLLRRSRLVRGEPFFRMQESAGPVNSETRIELLAGLARGTGAARYGLHPRTGRKHQLRVHMAAIGAGISNDLLYPTLLDRAADDYTRPLQLLARRLDFVDPMSGRPRRFESRLQLLRQNDAPLPGRAMVSARATAPSFPPPA